MQFLKAVSNPLSIVGTIFVLLCILVAFWLSKPSLLIGKDENISQDKLKLYWFIPDGLRADPEIFNIYRWAEQGHLPNIKRMMEMGSFGYSRPVYPGHTPTNFATLLTGTLPETHGVADGPMRIKGYPLEVVSKSGFSSVAKKVPPIWYSLEKTGNKVSVLSVPGSTPPELSRGLTIRGRWGGWGVDFPAVIFNSDSDTELRTTQGLQRRVFESGPELTKYVRARDPIDWQLELPSSFSPPQEVLLENWGQTVHGYIFDSKDDGISEYDQVLFSLDKKSILTTLSIGEWSDWHTLQLTYELGNDYNIYTPKKHASENQLSSINMDVLSRFHVIKLGEKGKFRLRILYDNLNRHSVKPSTLELDIRKHTGPMLDFVDNFPPQLIYEEEDKNTFLDELEMSIRWHEKAAKYLINNTSSNAIIHNIYSPNQMLTSRWWMSYLDPSSASYQDINEKSRKALFDEVLEMYQGIDDIIGTILDNIDENTVLVLSSDHGVVPLDREVRINNIFADHGLLKYELDTTTGDYKIDWGQSTAVFLKMNGVYINPNGLDGTYSRASGQAYEALREKVQSILRNVSDGDHAPLESFINWEDAAKWNLPKSRVADIIIANKPGYGWVEEITEDGGYFADSLSKGYKQAIRPEDIGGMLTPFIVVGKGVKKNNALGEVTDHVNQYPSIMNLIQEPIPDFVQGRAVDELFAD